MRNRVYAFALATPIAMLTWAAVMPALPAEAAPASCAPPAGFTNCVTYSFTGTDQTFTVPASVTTVQATVSGSGGQATTYPNSGAAGPGGLAIGTISGLTGGTALTLTVGGTIGVGGGGNGGAGTRGSGGHGGGYSAVWQDQGANTPYLLAGGGGGAGGANLFIAVTGGSGGGSSGTAGASYSDSAGGGGGTATAGGAPGATGATAGSAFTGGDGAPGGIDGGGGGGGGYFGGGGGGAQAVGTSPDIDGGGGGGSGFLGAVTGGSLTAALGADANTNGSIVLAWNAPAPVITAPADGSVTGQNPPLAGTAVPGNTVTVADGGSEICATVATQTGDWRCPTPPSFTPGSSHSLVATQTDQPGDPLLRYPVSTTVTFSISPLASPTHSTTTASPTAITADGTATSAITVTLRDAAGDPLPVGGDAVTMTATAGTVGAVTDNGGGTYTATLTAPTTVGSSVISFTVDRTLATATTTVAFIAAAASPATSTITASPTTIVADGTATSTITVTLRDAHRNPLISGGDAVTMTASGGSLGPVTDNGDGTYTATLTSPTDPGQAIVSFALDAQPGTQTATVTFTAIPTAETPPPSTSLAATGSDISLSLVAFAVLAVLGALALLVRRSARRH